MSLLIAFGFSLIDIAICAPTVEISFIQFWSCRWESNNAVILYLKVLLGLGREPWFWHSCKMSWDQKSWRWQELLVIGYSLIYAFVPYCSPFPFSFADKNWVEENWAEGILLFHFISIIIYQLEKKKLKCQVLLFKCYAPTANGNSESLWTTANLLFRENISAALMSSWEHLPDMLRLIYPNCVAMRSIFLCLW